MRYKTLMFSLSGLIIILLSAVIIYAVFAYRNHTYFEDNASSRNIDSLEVSSFFRSLNRENSYLKITIWADNYTQEQKKVDGYTDYESLNLEILLYGDTKIEYIEPSNAVTSLTVTCTETDEISYLENFTEYYPNLEEINFSYCSFPDDYQLDLGNITSIIFNYNSNVDYSIINNSKKITNVKIIQNTIDLDKLPTFNDNIETLSFKTDLPITYDFNTLPANIKQVSFYTSYEGKENETTIYSLEKFTNLREFSYDKAEKITSESYDYAIDNSIEVDKLQTLTIE